MRFRVDSIVYDFGQLEDSDQDRLMTAWHKNAAIECVCNGDQNDPNPLLYVKQVKDGLFFANYPSNSKNAIRHDYKCRYNRQGYRSLLQDKGIHVDENEIRVNLDVDPPRQKTVDKPKRPASAKLTDAKPRGKLETRDRKIHLTTLFYTMLQEFKVTEFRPGGRRNIASRLYKIARIIKVNDSPLSEMLYVADNKGKWPNRDKHQLLIGWGRRSTPVGAHPTNSKFIRLPLFSVDDPERLVTELTVLRSIFDQCTSHVQNVDTGYYVLFRGPASKSNKNIWDRQLCFIPAEEKKTRIPVDSAAEVKLIQYLADQRRHFERPVIGNVTELLSDRGIDLVLHDTEPKTIVSIADVRTAKGNERALQEKRNGYISKGFEFVEWDGISPIPL